MIVLLLVSEIMLPHPPTPLQLNLILLQRQAFLTSGAIPHANFQTLPGDLPYSVSSGVIPLSYPCGEILGMYVKFHIFITTLLMF